MKKITLPLTQTYSTSLDLKAIPKEGIVQRDGHTEIHFPQMDFGKSNEVLLVVRENGSLVVYAATSIEGQIDQILVNYLFGSANKPNDRKDFFVQQILQSPGLTYSLKRDFLSKIVNDHDLLEGKDKNHLAAGLKKIMIWRNAFAHGTIHYDATRGAEIKYFSGSPQVQALSDEYWTEVEECFSQADALLKRTLDELIRLDVGYSEGSISSHGAIGTPIR